MASPPRAPVAGSDEFDDGFDFTSEEIDAIFARLEAVIPEPQPELAPAVPPQTAPIPPSRTDSIVLDSDVFDDAMFAAVDALELSYEQELQQQRRQQEQEDQEEATPIDNAEANRQAPTTPPRRSPLAPLPLPPSSPPVATSSPTPRVPKRKHSRSRSNSPRKRLRTQDVRVPVSSVNKLLEEAQCPICYDHIVEPYTCAPCGHSACAPCLNTWLTTLDSENKRYECPSCRSVLAEERGATLVPNFALKNVANAMLPLLPADRQQSYKQRSAAWNGEWTYMPKAPEQPLFIPDTDAEDTEDEDTGEDDDISDSQLVEMFEMLEDVARRQAQALSRRNSAVVIDLT